MSPVIIGLLIAGGIILTAAALYLFAVFPTTRKHRDKEILKGLRIAHRGLHDVEEEGEGTGMYPENSLSAFELAAKNGYAIENDIHLTKDGVVIVFHDDNMLRMCGVDDKPENLTLEEIKKLRLRGTEETIPTLRECLDLINGRVPLLIEFKTIDKSYKNLCEKADEILKDYKGTYWIQSFYPMVLCWYKKHRPEIMRGQLSRGFKGESFASRLLEFMLFDVITRPDFVSYKYLDSRRFYIQMLRKLGCCNAMWTIQNQETADEYSPFGDAFIFETFYMKKE